MSARWVEVPDRQADMSILPPEPVPSRLEVGAVLVAAIAALYILGHVVAWGLAELIRLLTAVIA